MIKIIKSFQAKLIKIKYSKMLEHFSKQEDVQHFFSEKEIDNWLEKNSTAFLSIIHYEKNPTLNNWLKMGSFCFEAKEKTHQKTLNFNELKPTPLLFYALQYNVLDALPLSIKDMGYFEKIENVGSNSKGFKLKQLKLGNYSVFSMLVYSDIFKFSYIIEKEKLNFDLFKDDTTLNHFLCRAIVLNPEEKRQFVEKILHPLGEKKVDFKKLKEGSIFKQINELYDDYDKYMIEKEKEGLNHILEKPETLLSKNKKVKKI